jgi:hypothetical protein
LVKEVKAHHVRALEEPTVVMVASVYNIFKNNFANLMFLRVISLKMRVDTKVLLVEAQ